MLFRTVCFSVLFGPVGAATLRNGVTGLSEKRTGRDHERRPDCCPAVKERTGAQGSIWDELWLWGQRRDLLKHVGAENTREGTASVEVALR